MATLSTTAWVLHELGLAAGFGGNLFGLIALKPALAEIQSQRERGKVTHVAWDRYQKVNGTALAVMAGTWFLSRALRHRQPGRRGKTSRTLTIAKDLLVGGALVGGVGALVFGHLLDTEIAKSNAPLEIGSPPSAVTKQRIDNLQHVTNGFGRVNVLMNAAVLAVTAMLSATTPRSARRS